MLKLLLILAAWMAAACAAPSDPVPISTLVPSQVARASTPVPTYERIVQDAHAETPSPVPVCTPSPLARTSHRVEADIDYAGHRVAVRQLITYPNATSGPLDVLVLDMEPNAFPEALSIDRVEVDAQPTEYALSDRRLEIPLAHALAAGCDVTLALSYSLLLPATPPGWAGRSGYFGYTERQLNLGGWLALVAHRQGNVWIVHDTLTVGEQSVPEAADWDVTLRLTNAPEGTLIAAPGQASRLAEGERYVLLASRQFAVSVSPRFEKRSTTTRLGTLVELYTLGDTLVNTDRGSQEGADFALEAAVRALEIYDGLFTRYPESRLVVVQGDFADGMEFAGLIFIGEAWFRTWNGTPQSYLTIITVHEVAHQWWYSSVGSDQALVPWLDEALATYSEHLYYEETYPALIDWWWQVRVNAYAPEGFAGAQPVNSPVSAFADSRAYINSVYLQGARMLHRLRADLGTEAFIAWLSSYAAVGRGRVMGPDDIWALLTPQQLALTEATRAAYLGRNSP